MILLFFLLNFDAGYFLFASEKYSVFEGGGLLEVDVLFARALQ